MKIGIIGIRGYRAVYSGFETFVKKLVEKSNKKKFFYVLFVRSLYQNKARVLPKNISLVTIPTLKGKYIESFFYSLASTLISLTKRIDVVLYLGLPNTFLIFTQKLFSRKVVVNVNGFDWKRKRWNFFGKLYLRLCKILTVIFADVIITDSKEIESYYKNRYKLKKITYIPYGAEVNKTSSGKILKKFGLIPKKYIYTVGRFTPENSLEDLILAFQKLKTNLKCVIIGDSVYEAKYKQYLLDLSKNYPKIIFTGFLQEKDYKKICSNAILYVETKTQGGIHPSLLEAMAYGNCVIAKKLNSHIEVLGKNGIYYQNENDLNKKISLLIDKPKLLESIGQKNQIIIKKKFNWKDIIKKYEIIFTSSLLYENKEIIGTVKSVV